MPLCLSLAVAGLGQVDLMRLGPAEFSLRADLAARIDSNRFDASLLRAAIFHETNRVRRSHKLPAFTHAPKLDDAADLKAAVGVLQPGLQHENPLPGTRHPADRVQAVGLRYRRVAENLARLTIYGVAPGTTEIGVRQRGETVQYFDLKTKRPVEVNTYAGFASAVVDAWMSSPGHRENILNPELTSLGIAARPCASPINRQPQLYVVQVFFTPR